ncbi:TonB-dependent receptor [Bacteroides sp. 51]|uniref:SusC/RagA family TonB-linked outer membrane protein n=1 Tax=Bacteroides sp. 51 TaxID=2302938 RepID=UPI0013CFD531|nr:TonB-dependent receptor [Bacteroides sp. 51]NDV82730.1 TonB-dependent receptor [Bacteroides sp. 51]
MRKIRLINLLLIMFCCCKLMAQDMTVTGKIVDASAEPIIGASVQVKGTSKGTISDFDGNFSLQIVRGDMLQISYIGYTTQEIRVTDNKSLRIVMSEDAEILDEVIIVGTSMKKSDLTGAVASVNSKTLQERPVTNVNQALQGRVAGVLISQPTRPTDDASIKIRGINTINGSTDPIYVIDGMVMDNTFSGFNAVNLNDVASIEVLKDASATALYGSRGSNGVVVITTKKGKKGEGQVTYDGWIGFQTYAKTPNMMDTRQTFELRKEAHVNGFVQKNPTGDVDAYIRDVVMGSNTVFADYEFDAYNNNQTSDWLDAVSRTGVQHNHVVSFSNGTDKGTYYLSFGYMDNKGVIEKSEQKKYTGRINADQQIKPWLKVGTNTSFTRTEDTMVDDGVMNRARFANPMFAVNEDVLTLDWQGRFDENNFNPIRSLKIDNDRVYNRLMSSNYININPIEGLNFRSTFSVDYAQKQVNKYTPTDVYEAVRYHSDGEAKDNRDTRTVWQWDNSLSYDMTFGKHRINAMLGTSATRNNFSYINATTTGYGSDLFGYHNLGAGYKKDKREISTVWTEATLLSYIARANYSFAGKYMITATARYDGSSKFAKGEQWGIFPSVSAAWNIAEEKFMANQNIFDQLKLRVGFGVVGNQDIDDFAYLSLYNPEATVREDGSYEYQFVSNGRRATPKISWEKQQQWNLGVDMAFWNNRINFSVDAFLIKNKDLLMKHSLATTTGYKETIENIGAIENKGLEFALNANVLKTQDWNWNVSATLSLDKNKVTKLYGSTGVVYNVDGDRNIQRDGNLFVGESRNTLYMWRTGGIAQASDMAYLNTINWNGYNVNPGDLYPLDNGDGSLDQNDRVVIGSTDPKFYGGFATDLSWKGLALNAVFTYSYGAKKHSPLYESLISSSGLSRASTDLTDRWTPENTSAEFPRVIAGVDYNRYGVGSMDFAIQKASFLRLSALTLSYNLPKKVLDSMKVNNLRVYATGSNLFCLTSYKGYDPETGDWYPPTRMWTLGVNLAF